MAVRRIVAHLETRNIPEVESFYARLFGLDPVMQFGWISTLANGVEQPVQVSLTSDQSDGVPVPTLSIEVDDVDACHAIAQEMGAEIVYPITDESWNVRRFFVRDPGGHVLNVLTHH